MFTAIIRQHQALGSPVSAATLNRIRATPRAALNAAVRCGLITDNPASRAELPRARRPRAVVWTRERIEHCERTGERPPVAVWTPPQTAQFLDSIEDHRLYAAYHLIALRGLRRVEAAGLGRSGQTSPGRCQRPAARSTGSSRATCSTCSPQITRRSCWPKPAGYWRMAACCAQPASRRRDPGHPAGLRGLGERGDTAGRTRRPWPARAGTRPATVSAASC